MDRRGSVRGPAHSDVVLKTGARASLWLTQGRASVRPVAIASIACRLRALILVLTCLIAAPALGQERVTATGSSADGVGQLLLMPDGQLSTDLSLINNVAVLNFDREIEVDMSRATAVLRSFITLARLDGDGRALRLALRRGVNMQRGADGAGIVLTFDNGTALPDMAFTGASNAAASTTQVGGGEQTPPPAQDTFAVTLSPMLRPEPVPPVLWSVDVADEPGALVLHFSGGEIEIEASVSTRIAVLTFARRNRADTSALVSDDLALLEDVGISRAEDGRYRLTLRGVPGVIAAHRRSGTDLYVAFRQDVPEDPVAEGNEADHATDGTQFLVGGPMGLGNGGVAPEEEELPPVTYAGEASEMLVAELASPDEPEEIVTLVVEVLDTSDGIRLLFPWQVETPAAVFRRGNSLWIAFETNAELEIEALQRRYRGLFRNAETYPNDSLAVLRLEVPNYVLTTTSTDGFSWLVTLGEDVAEPTTPLEVSRDPNHEYAARIVVAFAGASGVHSLQDPDIGDEITLVTAPGPVRGLISPRVNVDFTLLETAQGLAVEEHSDNLLVSIADGQVVITSETGLALSEQIKQELEMAVAELSRDMPGYMDFETWSGGEDTSFLEARLPLLSEVAVADGAARELARMNLVRFYLARDYNAEALGVLHLMASQDPMILENVSFRSLRGVSLIRMRRFEAGIQDLSIDELQIDENAALWRGLARYEIGDIAGARREFSDGARMLNVYGPVEQARFRLVMARTAWASGDFAAGQDEIENVAFEGLPQSVAIEVELLRGMMAEGLNEPAAALEYYERVINSGYEPMVVRGLFRQTRLLSEMGTISPAETIDRLEAQRFRWRGDDLELSVLDELGRQYVADKQYRDGLNIWRMAVRAFPGNPGARRVGIEMQDVFVNLFIDGLVDEMPPIRALGLYYDFRELTPIGRQGDDMIRRLADRLVSVDLLEQAAELLDHQVRNRLRGVGRAQVATRLAIVYLLDRRPAEALQAIRSTRQTLLPEDLNRQRRMLEARALAAMDRFDQALDTIANERREEANRLRAEIQWEAEYWTISAESFEELLGAAWRSDRALDDEQRTDVMRAAIAYVFADDEVGLTRLRTKYARLMGQSPDAEAFEIVTGRIETQGLAFREMARRIAALDTFDAFMNRMRDDFAQSEGAAIN